MMGYSVLKCKHRNLRIAIPSNALSANPSIREKTLVAGYIARAAAALRAEYIDVYKVDDERGFDILIDVLRFLSEPVYLRKELFPLKPTLKYSGLLPPLNITALNEGFKDNEEKLFFKFGLIKRCLRGSRAIIDIGEEEDIIVSVRNCRKGIVLVGLDEKYRVRKVLKRKYGIWRGEYLGFGVNVHSDIYELIDFYKKERYVRIGTSKYGEWPGKLKSLDLSKVALIYGMPSLGLLDAFPNIELDTTINVIPCQGTKTVRLEEALWATVGLYSSIESGL